MTVGSENNKTVYAGDGATASFSTGFTFADNAEIEVTLVTDSTGAEVVWTEGTQYTLTGAGTGNNGTLTVDTSPTDYTPASGETLVIYLKPALTQGTLLPRSGDVSPKDVLEPMHDKRVRQILYLKDQLDRSIKASTAETSIGDLPNVVNRKNKVMAFDANGDPTVSTETLADIEGAATSAAAAAASEAAAAASEAAAAASETNAAASEAAAAAAAQGWSDVVSVTTGTLNIETTDANKYYILDASGGTITINLPAVGTTDGLTLAFEVLDASNSITIVRDGTDTINGVAGNYTSLTGVGDVVHFISVDGTPDDWSARLISRFVVDGTTITQSGRTISVGAGGVDTAQLADDAVDPTKAIAGRNAQTGTAYTLALTDNLKTVTMNNASANTLTIPTNASVAFTADETRIDVIMLGDGVTTVTGDTGVTVNGASGGSFDLAKYGGAALYKIGTDTWVAPGQTVA